MNLSISPKLLAAVATFRAIGDLRYYLSGVQVDRLPDGTSLLVATNGHALCAWRDESGTVERCALLHVTPALLAACKKRNADRVTLIEGRLAVLDNYGNELHIQGRAKGGMYLDNGWEMSGTFPSWQRVLPSITNAPTLYDSFCPVYLQRVMTAIAIGTYRSANSRSIDVQMQQGAQGLGIGVTSSCASDFYALVMPMRSTDSPAPKWVTDANQDTTSTTEKAAA